MLPGIYESSKICKTNGRVFIKNGFATAQIKVERDHIQRHRTLSGRVIVKFLEIFTNLCVDYKFVSHDKEITLERANKSFQFQLY